MKKRNEKKLYKALGLDYKETKEYQEHLIYIQNGFINRALANQTKAIMKDKGVSLEKLSEESHINIKSLEKYLSGKLNFRNDILVNITRALGITLEDFYKYGGEYNELEKN